ncbi:MAG: hypothetical protein LUQ38_04590 [Methanotrichaceae archaeon]|nr:hypothetical protein [Methanotrichaceae archaeon]
MDTILLMNSSPLPGLTIITLIVVGLPRKRRSSKIWKGSVVTRLTQRSDPIHVLVIGSTDINEAGHEILPSPGKYEPTTPILITFVSILIKHIGHCELMLAPKRCVGICEHCHDYAFASSFQWNHVGQMGRICGIS